jgi:4-hydroxythreonine-4-phosphate dehydrogenase
MKRGPRPIIGMTMGDAAGVGPEIIVKALAQNEVWNICRPVVIGDLDVIADANERTHTGLHLHGVSQIEDARFATGSVEVLDLRNINLKELIMGKPQAMAGKASFEYVRKAVDLALDHTIDAITTAPLSKEALNLAGYHYPGHTEILADLTGSSEYAMMFFAGSLRVILVTIHMSLIKACAAINKHVVFKTIRLGEQTLRRIGFETPRIAVAGLNPHASEGGLFGDEEEKEISPAVADAKRIGLDVSGPYSADTVYYRAVNGEFDLVVAMYHDQGCIPIKLVGFNVGVNVTVGLPIIRTSPDHGTAYRRAGLRLGTADPQSLTEALKLATKLADRR